MVERMVEWDGGVGWLRGWGGVGWWGGVVERMLNGVEWDGLEWSGGVEW